MEDGCAARLRAWHDNAELSIKDTRRLKWNVVTRYDEHASFGTEYCFCLGLLLRENFTTAKRVNGQLE